MSWLKRLLGVEEAGNAVLFSLIIMTSAMTITLGMASLVAGEIRSVGLVLPAERAYYKAESYVEQGLWQKKQDANYQVNDKSALPGDYLCANSGCVPFSSAPNGQNNNGLVEFFASTSPPQSEINLPQDDPQQFDIVTTGVTSTSGTLSLTDITHKTGYRGIELTVVAYSTSTNPAAQFPVDDPLTTAVEQPVTAVFVDKKIIGPNQTSVSYNLGTLGGTNPLGEQYPPLSAGTTYRLRIKALGSDAAGDLNVVSSSGSVLTLRSPDFTVRAVADDANSRRGIQVLAAASSQISSIFDFVVFSDYDLDKLRGKVNNTTAKSIAARLYRDTDQDCTLDANETGIQNIRITANQFGVNTDSNGLATFTNLLEGGTYTVTADLPPGTQFCTPPGNSQSTSFLNNASPETKQLTFLARTPLPPRVPLFRFFSGLYSDHAYTITPCATSIFTPCSGGSYTTSWPNYNVDNFSSFGFYSYEGIAGYLYSAQVANMQPLYRLWASGNDHFYTMSLAERDGAIANYGYVSQGTAGYLLPYTGSCPSGSAPLYRLNIPSDHFYTMSLAERNNVIANGGANEGITGCMWTSP